MTAIYKMIATSVAIEIYFMILGNTKTIQKNETKNSSCILYLHVANTSQFVRILAIWIHTLTQFREYDKMNSHFSVVLTHACAEIRKMRTKKRQEHSPWRFIVTHRRAIPINGALPEEDFICMLDMLHRRSILFYFSNLWIFQRNNFFIMYSTFKLSVFMIWKGIVP